MSAPEDVGRSPLRVALGEYDTGWHDPEGSLVRAEALVARARRAGARVVVLPEMATTGFSMESTSVAEPITGSSVVRLGEIAGAHDVWILAGVATRGVEDAGVACAYNSALLFAPTGRLHAAYHKQRLFAYAGEHRSYRPGAGPLIVEIEGVRVSPFICYDLRFPELFRAVAPRVDAFLLVANWPASRRTHWDVLVRARAIENQCYMIAVNRVGTADNLDYDGGSAAYGPWGDPATVVAGGSGGVPQIVEVDPALVADVRKRYPFLRDQHPAPPVESVSAVA